MSGRILRQILSTFILLFPSLTLARARGVESTERLRMLQQATGQTSSGSFQTKVDATFNSRPSLDKNYVAHEDLERKQALSAGPETAEPFLEEKPRGKTDLEEETEKSDREGRGKHPLDIPLEPRIRAGEKNYQKQMDEIYEESEQRQKEAKKNRPQPAEEKKGRSRPPRSGALVNNPFYFGADDGQKEFEKNKPAIIDRLVQMGYSESDAESLIQEASSPEEAIISLMQREGFSYGEAAEALKRDQES